MPSVTKWKAVPPFMVIDVRGWLVSTKTGEWYGGLSPHHPFQVSSGQGPRIGPNMLGAMIHAPVLVNPRAAKLSSITLVPPSLPYIGRTELVAKPHACNAMAPAPSGLSRSGLGRAP